MVKAYGSEFKQTLVYDRIKEDLRNFCANNTIDDDEWESLVAVLRDPFA